MTPSPSPAPRELSLRDPALYANRELSQLDFNFRVLAQAQDPSVPLLERLRFLCISCTNLDEFFEIRGGSVRHAIEFGLPPSADGLAPVTLLNRIHDRAAALVQGLKGLAPQGWLHALLDVQQPDAQGFGLAGSGVMVINPPHTLYGQLRTTLPWLAQVLAQHAGANHRLEQREV